MALGNKTLEDLLSPISRSLGRYKVPEQVADPDYKAVPVRATDGLDNAALVDMFADEAGKVFVQVRRCRKAGVSGVIADIVAQAGGGSVVVADDDRFAEMGVASTLEADPIVEKVTVWDPTKETECVDAAKQAAFGITYATAGIAETGTVLQPSSPKCGRSISLLPLAHIAVVDAATIVGTMADALKPYNEGELPMPGQLCFISGPSATADIELVRVEGVHGPMYVHYIVVE